MVRCGLAGQGDQGLQAVADGVGVRQFAFVGQNFPGGIKQRSRVGGRGSATRLTGRLLPSTFDPRLSTHGKPGFDVLLETFLGFQVRRDEDEWPPWENFLKQNREKRLCRLADAGAGQHSAILQSPGEGLHGGSLRDVSEQIACRRPAWRENARYQRTNRLPPTLSRFAPNREKVAAENRNVKPATMIQGGWFCAGACQPLTRITVMFSMGFMKLVEESTRGVALVI